MTTAQLDKYIETARAAGVEVSLLPIAEFGGRLAALLGEPWVAKVALASIPDDGLAGLAREAIAASGRRVVGKGEEREADLGVTFCATFLADTGSQVVRSDEEGSMLCSLLPPVHLAISFSEGCAAGLPDFLAGVGSALPSRMTLITGPSRTGDIEATMTTCVHGPGRVLHWIVAR